MAWGNKGKREKTSWDIKEEENYRVGNCTNVNRQKKKKQDSIELFFLPKISSGKMAYSIMPHRKSTKIYQRISRPLPIYIFVWTRYVYMCIIERTNSNWLNLERPAWTEEKEQAEIGGKYG